MININILQMLLCSLLLTPRIYAGMGFYNIAHMTNNIHAVQWGIGQGANAVEVDLQFHPDGTPYAFFHVSPCDCSCMCELGSCHVLYPNSVCVQLERSSTKPCDARTDAKVLLNFIAKQQLALVLIDSKLSDQGKKMDRVTQEIAAKKVIDLLEKELFEKGFQGRILVGGPYFDSFPFIQEIARTKSIYKHLIHFTVDQEDMAKTKFILDLSNNKNMVYNLGLSACSPTSPANFEKSKLTLINTVKGSFGMSFTWTVDRMATMEYYINYFNAIITNYPGMLTKVVQRNNMRLAKPTDVIPPATSKNIIRDVNLIRNCECKYHSGGCKITKPAPPGFACQCTYPFLWTCAGWLVACSDSDATVCKSPDLSKTACVQGRGDCGGY